MATSLIYRSALGYETAMRVLYGRGYTDRFEAIAALIPEGSSVLDVCCGPATLFHRYLKTSGVRYTGLDINRRFVARLIASGAAGLVWNVEDVQPLPRAEFVVIQASLYHFLPRASAVVERMVAAADKAVLIAEPIRNVAESPNPLLAFLGRRLTNPGTGDQPHRFNEARLDALMEPYRHRGYEVRSRLIAGRREKLYVLRVGASR